MEQAFGGGIPPLPESSRAEVRLPAEPIAPALARAALRSTASCLPKPVVHDLSLLVTEVVTNAVRHGTRGPVDDVIVRIVADDSVRVEVVDPGRPFDPPPSPERFDDAPSGWELFLLDRLATDWGVEAEGVGKKVWFEIDVGTEPPAPVE
jgi:anti-sigma regulatory factor (Ser/Thr protein kinase)